MYLHLIYLVPLCLGQVVEKRSAFRLSIVYDFIWKVLNVIGLL